MRPLTSQLLEGFEHGFGTRHSGLTQDAMVSLKQIHSGLVWTAPDAAGCVGEGDALVSIGSTPAVSIRTADCVPILLADRRMGAVAAIHAGWRGTGAKIVLNTLKRMQLDYGSDPTDIVAAIGPSIGACCYQVGDEVARKFGREGTCHIDLPDENRRQMETAGVPAASIEVLGACTQCDAERFWSYRREGERAGRMISFIRPR